MTTDDMVNIIKKSGLFDENYYLERYVDVKQANNDPVLHYVLHGAKEGRNPSPNFETSYYLTQNPDVEKSGMNPLLHYIQYGKKEGRKPASFKVEFPKRPQAIPKKGKLSIIIPHKDSVATLWKLLDSIEKEARWVEICVVDDHSSEAQSKLLDEVTDFYGKSMKNKYHFLKNEGKNAGIARNTALKRVSSEWILFADADDYFMPGWFNEVAYFFASSVDVVFFAPTSLNLASGKLGKRHVFYEEMVVGHFLGDAEASKKVRSRYVSSVGKLIRLSLLKKRDIRFGDEYVGEDTLLNIKVGLYAKDIASSPKPIYCITEGTQSLSGYVTLEKLKIRANILLKDRQFLQANFPEHLKYTITGKYLENLARDFLSEREVTELIYYMDEVGLER